MPPRPPIALVSTILAVSCTDGQGAPLPIIDAHVHTRFEGDPEPASGIPRTEETFLAAMDAAGVVGAVSHTDSAGNGYDPDLVARGIIFCAGIGATMDTARIAAGLREGRYRCLKIYLGYVARYPSDPVYEPAYALAARHDVPVVFHTGDTYSADGRLEYAHPLAIDGVAVDHRSVTFVIAHAGYPWYRTAAEVAYKNPNVYIEASAFMVGDPAEVDGAWLEQFVVEPIRWVFGYVEDPTKLMFGSDWPLVDMVGYVDAYKRAIPREYWRAVFHENATRVFRIDDQR
jgi:hypothetical protein